MKVPVYFVGSVLQYVLSVALYEKDNTERVWAALDNQEIHVVVQVAPAVRVALGEEFGMPRDGIDTGKMVTALRRLGFDPDF